MFCPIKFSHFALSAQCLKFIFTMMRDDQKKEIIKKANTAAVQKTIARIAAKTQQLTALITSSDSTSGVERVPIDSGWTTIKGRSGGNRKLVGLGSRQGNKVRPNFARGVTRAAGSPLNREVSYTVNGLRTAVATRHASLASYSKAVNSDFNEKVPLNTGTAFRGARHQEFEYMRGSEHHVRVSGREYLMSVSTHQVYPLAVGERFPAGVAVLDPRGVGGRLQYFAESYAQHKFLKCRLCYEPVAPATESGAIFIYFAPDIGENSFIVGSNFLQHASTFPCFMQTAVWQEASLDIRPEDALLRYFDSTVGEFRSEAQGVIAVATASDLRADLACGVLYLEYDVDFFAPELDFELSFRQLSGINFSFSAVTGAVSQGQAILAADTGIAAGYGLVSVNSFPAGATVFDDLVDWMFYGVSTTSALPVGFLMDALGNNAPVSVAVQGWVGWFRFWTSNAAVLCGFYPSMLSASQDEGTPTIYNSDAVAYYGAAYTHVAASSFHLVGWWYLIR